MSDPTAPVSAEGTAAPESAPSGLDFSPVTDRVGELASSVGELQNSFQQFVQSQQPEPEPEPDHWAELFGEPTPEAEPEQQQPQLNQQALQNAINQAIQSANAPLQQQLQALQMERATSQLYEQIPQLRDTPENAEIRAATAQRVQANLANYAPEVAQILSNDPAYIAMTFKAAEAEKLAQGQAPAGETVPSLEAAGGAHPGGNGAPANPVDQIFADRASSMPEAWR